MQFQSKIPLCFWGDCILTAVHLINRIPSKALSNKSPYEVLFHSAPSYHHLRNFGCLCFISTVSHLRHKFAPRAENVCFLAILTALRVTKFLIFSPILSMFLETLSFMKPFFLMLSVLHLPLQFWIISFFSHASISDINSDLVSCPSSFPPFDPIHDIPDLSPDHVFAEPLSVDSIFVDPIVVTNTSLASQSSNPIPCDSNSLVPLRRSTRSHKPPSYLSNYSCQFASTKPSSSMPYALSDHLSCSHLGPIFHSFVMAVSSTPSKPVSF